ncbi:unnamed protein product [Ceratitis capitata]|uniref:(Mediterranean fruit fly) hypothetical protein n=1 Tax=Ceratitis capitata TaxID=7213 RepID=A0A811VCL4_CERCA|nr:unnamed protein product [Ceratitis capitata]
MRLSLTFVLLAVATIPHTVPARRLLLRPLDAREVYQLLANTGRSDAIPQGRIITQGVAYISNLTRRLIGVGNEMRVSTQEVCFESRNARSLGEAAAVLNAYVAANNVHEDLTLQKRVRGSEVGRILKLKKRKKLRTNDDDGERRGNKRIRNEDEDVPMSRPGLGSPTATTMPTYSADTSSYSDPQRSTITTNPAITNIVTNTAATMTANPTTANRKTNDATITTTTSTTPEGAINCIVIKKNEKKK